jgi:PUA domain protein
MFPSLKKWVLSKHDSEEVLSSIEGSISKKLGLPRSTQVTFIQPKEDIKFAIIGELIFIEIESIYVPFLGSRQAVSFLSSVTVDTGAVKFILNGANVMRPGILNYDDWGEEGKLLAVREVAKGRAIAVGKALLKSNEMLSAQKGQCIKNIHYLGDKYWNIYKLV